MAIKIKTIWAYAIGAISLTACSGEGEKYPTVNEVDVQGTARTSLDSPEPSQVQLDRRKKNTQRIKSMGLPVLESLPVIEDEKVIKPRDAQQVAKRSIATVICAVKGETLGKDEALVKDLVKRYQANKFFSPEEKLFIGNKSPEQQEYIDHAWQYECQHVYLWALGHIEKLNPPGTICDVSNDVEAFQDQDVTNYINKAKLRSTTEIFDMADYYYRLHWAAIELRINNKETTKIDEGIIRERHRALNWLIRYLDQDWDEVTTDT